MIPDLDEAFAALHAMYGNRVDRWIKCITGAEERRIIRSLELTNRDFECYRESPSAPAIITIYKK